jgi:endoglucanase
MNRRQFLLATGTVAAATATLPALPLDAAEFKPATAQRLPRWRGFNLLEKFTKRQGGNPGFNESDFALIADWGFDFARLPMSYLCWTDSADWLKLREEELTSYMGDPRRKTPPKIDSAFRVPDFISPVVVGLRTHGNSRTR